ncbi:MAG: HAMP domain-containing histidine kinase [Chloroflexi bacterium]|nr:HAMP domain-containing histidine kinase [Chloroflexota bacterium]
MLVVYAPRAPIFVEDDLALVQLLADQAAVVLESRALIDEAARVQALEESTRLKEDFLSAAAHDLKTPLTTILAQAQLLERHLKRRPDSEARNADLAGVGRIVVEGQRLRDLMLELLDTSRVEQGRLLGRREPVDLVALAQSVCARYAPGRCVVEAEGPVTGEFDRSRIGQLLENLVENALKYSPTGEPVRVRLWVAPAASETPASPAPGGARTDGSVRTAENVGAGAAAGSAAIGELARIAVSDRGIGIPPADLPHVFDRFYRAANVDDRRFAGMGLGLYICRGIVERHGGRIWVESHPGEGSTFHVALPLWVRVAARAETSTPRKAFRGPKATLP